MIYNAPFDWPFQLAEAQQHRIDIPDVRIVDPLILDRPVDRFRRGSRRLEDTARHYGCALDDAHDAKADAVAAVAVARAFATRFSEAGERSPDELHHAQVGWYAAWASDFAEYRGEPVDASWTVPEHAAHLR